MIKSSKLNKYNNLLHGFTTNSEGDFSRSNYNQAVNIFGIQKKKLTLAEQIHSDKVAIVESKDAGKLLIGVDGMVTKVRQAVLGIRTADCIPLLLYDPVHKIIGAAHIGWRGTLNEISVRIISAMVKLEAKPKDIIATIGPHIGACCYLVNQIRTNLFLKKFGRNNLSIVSRADKSYLDLGRINYQQLVAAGLLIKNIEANIYCTSCQSNLFFSFRRDNRTRGRMLNYICLLN